MGFGHAVARSGRDFIDAAGIVLALPAGNQKYAERRAVCQRKTR